MDTYMVDTPASMADDNVNAKETNSVPICKTKQKWRPTTLQSYQEREEYDRRSILPIDIVRWISD